MRPVHMKCNKFVATTLARPFRAIRGAKNAIIRARRSPPTTCIDLESTSFKLSTACPLINTICDVQSQYLQINFIALDANGVRYVKRRLGICTANDTVNLYSISVTRNEWSPLVLWPQLLSPPMHYLRCFFGY